LQKWESTARQVALSVTSRPGLTSCGTADAAPPVGAKKKQFSEVLSGKNEERQNLTVKPKENQSKEEIKKLLKTKIHPVNMKIGIRTFKSLKNGNVLIEADRKRLRDYTLRSVINAVTRFKHTQKRRNPRLMIYNIPEAVSPENAEDIILAQNPNLKLQEGDIQTKFIFKSKRNTRNLVVEVNTQTRRQLLQNKLKLETIICNIDDYVSVNKCFKCSLFNHRHADCNSEEACPLCAGKHKLKECTASRPEYKCINCVTQHTTKIGKPTKTTHHSIGTVPVCRQ